MAIDFSKFDKKFDVEQLKKDVAEADENGGNGEYKEIPLGKYVVKIDKMELGETGENSKVPGSPMVKIQFRIVEGDFENSCLFMNQVITEGFQISNMKRFLTDLDSGVEIAFESYEQFAELLLDIHEAIDKKLEYTIEYGETKKGFKTFKIEEVFDAE